MGYVDGWNLYPFGTSSPVSITDAFGLESGAFTWWLYPEENSPNVGAEVIVKYDCDNAPEVKYSRERGALRSLGLGLSYKITILPVVETSERIVSDHPDARKEYVKYKFTIKYYVSMSFGIGLGIGGFSVGAHIIDTESTVYEKEYTTEQIECCTDGEEGAGQ